MRVASAIVVMAMLAGCSTTQVAPVEERGVNKASAAKPAPRKVRDWRPATHTVVKGDTLYSIALEYGLDYRELSAWNKLNDVNVIYVGQVLRLAETVAAPVETVQVSALKPNVVATQPLVEVSNVEQPLALKLPYSEQAVVQLKQAAMPTVVPPTLKSVVVPVATVTTVKEAASKDVSAKEVTKETAPKETDDVALDWMWPTQGRMIAEFSEAKSSKGIDIAGTAGQAVYAAAAGKVVYSGAGLRGYGKLVIIKHNVIYLSAYAHNQQILVKEGQVVTRGQKIAEMGNTDADQVKLHFEIRQMGKPVDPLKYLPDSSK
ncbi:MAG: peptidoglycan DD-metalloendopeptidase family protein [Sulfuriferula sp.]|nr:peptidoglycan DD-metalloendopeptidase family protein [Sulfuriferula sp.]